MVLYFKSPILMPLFLVVEQLCGCFSCSRGLFQKKLGPKELYLGILGMKLEKTIVIFDIFIFVKTLCFMLK